MSWLKKMILTAAVAAAVPMSAWAAQDIVILHTNDVHAGVEGGNVNIAQVAQYKKEMAKAGHPVVLVDAGDFVQGSSIATLSKGAELEKLMNAAGYDFTIPGNHEFDYSMQMLLKLDKQSNCGYFASNILDVKTGKSVFPSYKIIKAGDKKIGFVGVSTPETLIVSAPSYFQDGKGNYLYNFCEDNSGFELYNRLQFMADVVRAKGADYVILVGHLGTDSSIPRWSAPTIARKTHGFDFIIDGHSHEVYKDKFITNNEGKLVQLSQTGTKLQNLGKITINSEGQFTSEMLDKLGGNDKKTLNVLNKINKKYDKLLNQPVAEIKVDLTDYDPATKERIVRNGEAALGNFITDAVRNVLGADVSFINGGGLRASLPKGDVTYNDVVKVLPFDNQGIVVEVTGQQLLDAVEMGASMYPRENGGFLHVSGMEYTIDSSIPSSVKLDAKGNFVSVDGKYRVTDVKVAGKPLELDKKYTVAGFLYVLLHGGNGMTMFKGSKVVQETNLSDVNIVMEYMQNHLNAVVDKGYDNALGEGRIHIK